MNMINQCDTRKGNMCSGNITGFDGINLIYAGGHCHSPSCLSMELYNADTGKLLCRQIPVFGQSDEVIFLCMNRSLGINNFNEELFLF